MVSDRRVGHARIIHPRGSEAAGRLPPGRAGERLRGYVYVPGPSRKRRHGPHRRSFAGPPPRGPSARRRVTPGRGPGRQVRHGAGRSGRESMPPRRRITLRGGFAGQPAHGLSRQGRANMPTGPAPAPAQVDAGRGHVGACRSTPQPGRKCARGLVRTCARRVRTSSTRQHRVAVEHGPDVVWSGAAPMPSPAPLTRHPSRSGTHRPRSARRGVARATRADRATVPGRLLSGNPGFQPVDPLTPLVLQGFPRSPTR